MLPRMARSAGENVRKVLLEALDLAFDKRSWHGANLTGALRGVTPAVASARVAGRKTIWEQLLHAAYWKRRAATMMSKAEPEPLPRKGSNWLRAPAETTEAEWRADLQFLRRTHERLRKAVAALPPERLDAKTVWLIHGAAAHDLYHAGQIKLLRRLIAGYSLSRCTVCGENAGRHTATYSAPSAPGVEYCTHSPAFVTTA